MKQLVETDRFIARSDDGEEVEIIEYTEMEIRRRPGASSSASATRTGSPEAAPTTDGVLRCVPENDDSCLSSIKK
jgi:hypothetical protein